MDFELNNISHKTDKGMYSDDTSLCLYKEISMYSLSTEVFRYTPRVA